MAISGFAPQITDHILPNAIAATSIGSVATAGPAAPLPTANTGKASDASTFGTVALFASVIGVCVGWALKELSTSLRGRAEASREREAAERDRVLAYLHAGDTLTAAANGLVQVYGAAARGRSTDPAQLLDMTNQFNASQSQLSRLRLEIYLLGPDWAVTPTFEALNGAIRLQAAAMNIEKRPGKTAYDEYLAAALAFKDLRQDVMKLAKTKLGGSKSEEVPREPQRPASHAVEPEA